MSPLNSVAIAVPESMDFSILTAPGQEELQNKNMSFIQEYQSLFMMFYIPMYALIARITFVGLRRFNYTEFLVIFMFTQAQIPIVSAFSTVILAMCGITHGVISLIMLPLMIIYNAFVLKRLYKLTIGSMIARILFFVILGVCFVIGGIIAAIIMFINGDFQEIMEAQKAAKEVAVVFIN